MLEGEGFSTDHNDIQRRLDLCDELRRVLMMEGGFPSDGFSDTAFIFKKAEVEGSFLEVEEVVALRRALGGICDLVKFFSGTMAGRYPALGVLTEGVNGFADIVNHIDSIIDRHGSVKDSASPELYSLRRAIRDREGQVAKRLQQILGQARSAGLVDADATVSIREGRAVIPVPAANKRKVRGFIHDESATGKTFFIEPVEVVEINNELRELEYAERREVVRILAAFTDTLRPHLEELEHSGRYLSTVEMIWAKARWALDNGAVRPILSRERVLELRGARHPLLAQTLAREKKTVVPLSLRLDAGRRILVISGPNAGGKSVCLKTVGLLQQMVQCGFLVPVLENSEMPLFDRIFLDIGDQQSIDNDLSTYSSHLLNMKTVLSSATARSLVLIDEFGSGTEPVIGGALAEAILERLRERGCFGVVTTHYSNLKYYASDAEGVVNGAMTFDVQHISPLFQLEVGIPGSSFAVEIARKIGLPEEIIRSAGEKAGSEHVGIEKQLRDIARDRRYWEQKRERIRLAERRVEELEAKYAAELERIRAERSTILRSAKAEARSLTEEANKQIENAIKTIRESQAERGATLRVRRELDGFREELASERETDEEIARKITQIEARRARRAERRAEKKAAPEPKPEVKRVAEVGSKIRIAGQDVVGEVLAIRGKKATVGFGQITTTVGIERLEVVSASEYARQTKPVSRVDVNISERKLNFKQNIDVRGMRAAEALEEVADFMDNALMVGVSEVRILHGKGTGALKEEIRRYLRTLPQVAGAGDEHVDQGGAGITVVQIKN